MKKEPKYVRVDWVDASGHINEFKDWDTNWDEWITKRPVEQSYGFLIYEDDRGYILAHQLEKDGDIYKVADFTFVPKQMVLGKPKIFHVEK